MSYRIRIASAVPLVLVLATASQAGIVIHVDAANCPGPGDGSALNPYCSIQTAIDNAVDTDEIVVSPGTYFETIILLGKAITLRSADGPEVTIIDATGNFHVVRCVSFEGPDTVIDGFTITGGDADGVFPDDRGGGMLNFNSAPTVTNCEIVGNSATNGGGMYNQNNSPVMTNCNFSGNIARSKGGGMYNISTFNSNPTLTNCTFGGNIAGSEGGGIYSLGSIPTLIDCTICGNDPDEISGPFIDGGVTFCIAFVDGDNCPGPGDGSELDPYCSIQTAIDSPGDRAEIIVAPGTYVETINFRGEAIVLRSAEGPEVTIIDATGLGRVSVVTCETGEGPDTVLRGFTITGGTGTNTGGFHWGGGMFNFYGDPTVVDCRFNGNAADNGGGMANLGGRPTVTDCTFSGNSAEFRGGGDA